MATPLNTFKTKIFEATTTDTEVYSPTTGFTGIIIMAQATNISSTETSVTFSYVTPSDEVSELVKDFFIAGNDATSLLSGKLIVEDGGNIQISASENNRIKLTLSILESLNP